MTSPHRRSPTAPTAGPPAVLVSLLARLEGTLFVLTAALAIALIWSASRLPLTDYPQHAAQVALWHDLILGRSPWSDLVRVNLLTPYLIGYGLALPLSFVVSVDAALRIVLSVAFLAFLLACKALRRALGSDPRLDWLFLFGFFGFAWQWGFLTFLVAAPVGVVFLLVSYRTVVAAPIRGGLAVVVAGLVLLFSHGLLFVVMVPIGAAMATLPRLKQGWRAATLTLAPFAILGLACAVFRFVTAQAEGAMRFDRVLYGDDVWLKPIAALAYVTGNDLASADVGLPLTAALLFLPFLFHARLGRGIQFIPFAGIVAAIALLPNYAFQTAFLFHRFALFLLPFYALMFRPQREGSEGRRIWLFVLPALASWVLLGQQAIRIAAFNTETRSFETVLAAAEPGKRALALTFDFASPAANNATAYLHMPSWYQVEKRGFVDFNFASYHPQVVRFRAGRGFTVAEHVNRHPETFAGSAETERLFDYIFVRGSADDLAKLLGRSVCGFAVRASAAPWTLLERGSCPAAS